MQDILITPQPLVTSGEPSIAFTASGDVSPITLFVLSGISPVSGVSQAGSGITSLSFEGTQGQLFSVVDNLSSGTLFSVSDIAGLPFMEIDASGDVKIAEFGNSVSTYKGLDFLNTTNPPYKEGRLFYDDDNKALSYYNEEADVTLQIGQEEFLRARNNTGATISNGSIVMINGAHGNVAPTISGAIATSSETSQAVGVATHDIEDNSFGYVTTYGVVRDVDTSAFSDGDEIYLSSTDIGSGVPIVPGLPNYKVSVGHVIRSHANAGSMLVQIKDPRLAGGDTKSEYPVYVSGIPFVVSSGDGSVAVLNYSHDLRFDPTNGKLGIGLVSNNISNNLTVYDSSLNYPLRVGNNTANFDGSWTGMTFFNSTNTLGGSTQEGSASIRAYRYSARGGLGNELEFLVAGTSMMRFDTEGHVGISTITPDAKLHTVATAATDVGIIAQGAAAQSANLTEWLNSASETLAHVDSGGNIATSGDVTVGFGGNIPEGSVRFAILDGTFSRIHGTTQGIRVQGYQGVTNFDFDRYFNYCWKTLRPSYATQPSLGYDNQGWGNAYIQQLILQKTQFANATQLDFDMMKVEDASGDLSMVINSSGDMFLYNTYTDASNYERLEVKWDANNLTIDSTAAGTGTARAFDILYDGGRRFRGGPSFAYIYQGNGTYIGFGNNYFNPQQDSTINLGSNFARWANTYTDELTITSVPDVGAGDQDFTIKYDPNFQVGGASSKCVLISTDMDASGDATSIHIIPGPSGAGNHKGLKIQDDSILVFSDLVPQSSFGTDNPDFGVITNPFNAGFVKDLTVGAYFSQFTLSSDGANKMALRKGTSAQQLNVYNTYTDASNYERLELKYVGNEAIINTEANGTGTVRALFLATNGTKRWELTTSGGLRPVANVTYSLGTSNNNINQVLTKDLNLGTSASDRSILTSDAADTLALRNSTTPQAFNIYNTYTDASNYERLEFKWDTNVATISAAAAGTGTLRDLKHYGKRVLIDGFDSAGLLKIYWRGNERYRFETGAFFPTVDSASSSGKTSFRWSNTYTDALTVGNGVDTVVANSSGVTIDAQDPSASPFVVQGASSQNANLTEWKDSAGDVLSQVDSAGAIHAGGPMYVYTSGAVGDTDYQRIKIHNDGSTAYATQISTEVGGSASVPWAMDINNNSSSLLLKQNGGFEFIAGSTKINLTTSACNFYVVPRPVANNTYDLGQATRRWSNTYTADLDVSGVATFLSDGTANDSILLVNYDTGTAAAPILTFKRDSASPADGDYLGQIKFKGENDADQEVVYAKITGKTSDVTDTTEDGLIETMVKSAGSNLIVSRQTGTALKLINGVGLESDGPITAGGSGIPASEPITGASGVVNMMVINSGTYAGITPDSNTIYFIVDP